MNAANLQRSAYAVAGMHQALMAKGLLTTEELDRSLAVAEQTVLGEDPATEGLSPATEMPF